MPANQQDALHIKIGSAVRSREGHAGRVINVIVEPDSSRMTHIVVESSAQPARDAVVPVVLIVAATNDTVDLDLSTSDLIALPAYVATGSQGEEESGPRGEQTVLPAGENNAVGDHAARTAEDGVGQHTLLSDEDIAAAVSDALAREPRTANAVIDVAYSGGSVTLEGQVCTRGEKVAAVEVARGVPGVVAVIDEIEILPDAVRKKWPEARGLTTVAAADLMERP